MKKPTNSNLSKQRNTNMKSRKVGNQYSTSSLSDPMNPLQNTYLKEKRINMIINFLSQNNYQNNYSKKDFINMTIDFRPILKFIMEKLDPNMNLLESQTEDKIEALSKIYEYPGKLNKNFIRDFNTPSNFLYILTFICYMANLCSYKDYFTNNEIHSKFYKTDNNISTQISGNNEDITLDDRKEYYEFLDECIKSLNSGDNTDENQTINDVIEKYKNKFNTLCNEELNKIEQNFAEYEKLEKENKIMESQLPSIDIIKAEENDILQKLNNVKAEYEQSNEDINLFKQKLIDISNKITEQENKLKLLDNDIKSTRNIIDTQIMSRAEYDIQQEENNNILNKVEMIQKDINVLQNTKNDIINTNQSLINKLTLISNDINNIDINNTKTIKSLNNNINDNNDFGYLLNMTLINKEIKNNIINNEIYKNKELLDRYDQIILKYKSYITDIKNDYNSNIINNNELLKNKNIIISEIDKYNNYLMNDNQINEQQKEIMNKLNNDFLKYNKENSDYINIINNDIKIYENNIDDKKQKLLDRENEYNNLKIQFDEFKNETYELINALTERYNLYYNNFIDFSNEITNKIVNCNQKLKNICDSLPKNDNNGNEKK